MADSQPVSGWFELRQVHFLPAHYPFGDPAVMLPATVLLLAGLGSALAAFLARVLHGLGVRVRN